MELSYLLGEDDLQVVLLRLLLVGLLVILLLFRDEEVLVLHSLVLVEQTVVGLFDVFVVVLEYFHLAVELGYDGILVIDVLFELLDLLRCCRGLLSVLFSLLSHFLLILLCSLLCDSELLLQIGNREHGIGQVFPLNLQFISQLVDLVLLFLEHGQSQLLVLLF